MQSLNPRDLAFLDTPVNCKSIPMTFFKNNCKKILSHISTIVYTM